MNNQRGISSGCFILAWAGFSVDVRQRGFKMSLVFKKKFPPQLCRSALTTLKEI